MGTNYYHYDKPPCTHCGALDRSTERHIGKSSAGWCFSLHVYPGEGIKRIEDWLPLWESGYIRDEYQAAISKEEMLSIVTERRRDQRPDKPFGYASWAEFYQSNHATPGPNNLLRHQVDGRHCIGTGEGTWDHIIGDFS